MKTTVLLRFADKLRLMAAIAKDCQSSKPALTCRLDLLHPYWICAMELLCERSDKATSALAANGGAGFTRDWTVKGSIRDSIRVH